MVWRSSANPRVVETEDQNKIPTRPLPQAGPGEPSPDASLTDSILGAMIAGAHSGPTSGPWQPPSPEELQRDFPLYEIRGILGRGGMGAVYKGWQKSLDRFVAIKILPPLLDDGISGFAERFTREAKAMAQLRHPGIVAVFDAGTTPSGLLYFVMECIEGTDVQRLVSESRRIEPGEALRITSAVCDALGYAHDHGIIHRDIKPSNVMLDADGTVKVADFGLAKSTSPETTQLTMSNVAMGTPDFMAPESHYGAAQVDHRADLYAVGVMLYEMLTGRLPKGRFDPPSRAVPGLDKRLDAIVDKALQTLPAARWSSAVELRTAIEPVTRTLAKRIADTSAPAAARRKRILLALAAVLIAAVAIGGWFLWKGRDQHAAGAARPPSALPASPPQVPQSPVANAPVWHDALAEEPLKRVVARLKREPQGYVFDAQNHYTFPPTASVDAVALRWRGELRGNFPTLSLAQGWTPAVEFRVVSGKAEAVHKTSTGQKMLAKSTRLIEAFGADKPRAGEMLLLRLGGRLRLWLDGAEILDMADPLSGPVQLRYIIYNRDTHATQALDYLPLDGLSEADALKAAGLSPSPSPQVTGAAAPAPNKKWMKVFTKAEDLPEQALAKGLKWTDGWIDGTGADSMAIVNVQGGSVRCRNGGIRLHGKVVAEVEKTAATLSARRFSPGAAVPDDRYQLSLVRSKSSAAKFGFLSGEKADGANIELLSNIPLDTPLAPGGEFDLEFYTIGDKLIGRLSGKTLPIVTDSRLTGGNFGFQTRHLIRDVEIINLDGLSEAEALKAAGIPGSTIPQVLSAPAWNRAVFPTKIATDEIKSKGGIGMEGDLLGVWKDAIFTANLKQPLRDAAVRITAPTTQAWWPVKLVSRITTGQGTQYTIHVWPHMVEVRRYGGGDQKLKTFPLAQPLTEGGEFTAQFASIGSQHYVWINGQLLGSVTDDADGEPGKFGVQANDGRFKSVETLSLDGLTEADALKAAGIDRK